MATPEQKLKRFLHFGKETPFYQPGDRSNNQGYQPTELSSVEALVANKLPAADTVNIIVKAFSDGYSPYPETLVYALAICARQKTSQVLREAAYNAVKTVCASTENLFLFIKYCTKLAAPHSMWGSGSRRVIKDWYSKKDVKQLAEIVTRNKSCHGWSHKDVIKMIHFKTDEPARAAIIKYCLCGIKAAKDQYGDKPEAQEVLNYIQTIEDVLHATDEQNVARSIEQHHLTLHHLPTKFAKSKEVWASLIPNLPLSVLIKTLQRIGYLGLLKPGAPLVTKVVDTLSNESAIAESHLHPAQVFVALRNYEVSAKYMAADHAQKKKEKTENGTNPETKKMKTPPKANAKIVTALYDLFDSTCKLLSPTGLRYLVAIDIKSIQPSDKCFHCPHVQPAQAAVLTALCLLKAERNVAVCQAGSNGDVVALALESSMSLQQGLDKLKQTNSQKRLNTTAPIDWALRQKKQFDVFVLITDGFLKGSNQIVSVLKLYRTDMNLPNAKLITNLVKSPHEVVLASSTNDSHMLDIGGFDGNVPKIIEGFSRGAF